MLVFWLDDVIEVDVDGMEISGNADWRDVRRWEDDLRRCDMVTGSQRFDDPK